MAEIRKVIEGDVTVLVKKPSQKEISDSQIAYNKAWKKALDENVIIRAKLNEYLSAQGIWSDAKQKQYEDFVRKINDKELVLKKGGIPLKKAKSIAFDIKRLRTDFRELISERTSYDNNTAEGVADNARFDYLVSVCVLDPSNQKPIFKNLDDYNEKSSESWAIKAAGELANFLYNLDPEYENNLEENKFLKRFKFVDEKGRPVNKDGHLISIDSEDVERLIDEKGYYVAYDENGNKYYINRSGEKVERDEDIVQEAFLDDDGNPVVDETSSETSEEVVPENKEDEPKKAKKKKTETD